jgi:hypothetical protein
MKTDIEFIAYGEIYSRLAKTSFTTECENARISTPRHNFSRSGKRVFVTFSYDLDKSFVQMFREKAKADSRLLIFDQGIPADRLSSRIVDLQIRTSQRFYIFDSAEKSHLMDFVCSVLRRFTSAQEAEGEADRILYGNIRNGFLHVVSSNFNRLEVPLDRIPELKKHEPRKIENFEIDDDGAFIYWPAFDLHLGWAQLQQAVNPEVALKAAQKSEEFNRRYGKAVRTIREKNGFKPTEIAGLSDKQLRRIENGECRLTSNAMEALAKAHKLAPNDYMKLLADSLN